MLFVILYCVVAFIVLLGALFSQGIEDGMDFLLVLPLCVFAALGWPVFAIFFGIYQIVKVR